MKITFPDGSQKEYPIGITGQQIAESISHKLAKDALGIFVNMIYQLQLMKMRQLEL
jgi:threonyl-tRNA synthetase